MMTQLNKPIVSVIIPCYNQAQYLEDSVNSIIAQTEPNWECIIVNDGSSDNTRDVATKLVSKDTRVKYIEQSNTGLAGARNTGLRNCNGHYIQFLDSDDYIYPTKFEEQLKSINNTDGLVVSYTDFECISESPNVEVPAKWKSPYLDEGNPLDDIADRFGSKLCIPVHSIFFDARYFILSGIEFDTDLPACEDFYCWLRIFALHPTVVRVNKKLLVYRWHDGSMMQDSKLMRKGYRLALKKAMMFLPKGSKARVSIDRHYYDNFTTAGQFLAIVRKLSRRIIGEKNWRELKKVFKREQPE